MEYRSPYKVEDRRVRFAVVGCGRISDRHFEAIKAHADHATADVFAATRILVEGSRDNPRSEVSRKDEYRNTLVKRGATLGANSTIVCGITIGEYATVGAGAMVDRDVPAFALMLGIPARLAGWMSRFGERLNLPLDGDAETECPNTGERYTLHDNVCTLVPAD